MIKHQQQEAKENQGYAMQPGAKNKGNIEVAGMQADLHKGIRAEVNIDMQHQLNRAADQMNARERELLQKFD